MPFTEIKSGEDKGKYNSPSGKVLTGDQVKAYYAKNPITMKTGPFKMKGWSPFTQKEHEYKREESMRTVSGVEKFKQFIKTLPISRTVRKAKRAMNIYKQNKG